MRSLSLALALAATFATVSAHAQEPCAAEKARIDERLAEPGYTDVQRRQGEQLRELLTTICATAGPQVGALAVSQLDMILPLPAADSAVTPSNSTTSPGKEELTDEYRSGQSCRGSQEATSYDFAPDGSYRYAVVGWNVTAEGPQYFKDTLPKSEFLSQFDNLESKDDNCFVTSVGSPGRSAGMEFTRGACEFMSVGAAG
jgi:hypothetical protein